MLSANDLQTFREVLDESRTLSTDQFSELIDECHRLRHLIHDLVEFRHSEEHDKQMQELRKIHDLVEKGAGK
ncbi:MAG: hypothetical protein ACXAC5_02065 [Promethearchaeota archaeon]|jgi:hypothetical protein